MQRARGRAGGDRQRARDHPARRRVAQPGGRTLPRRQAPAARRRQLRARARRRAVHRRPAGRLSRADRARHQPRAARAAGRGALPRPAARAARARDARGPGDAGRRGRGRAVRRARASPRSRRSSSATATPRRSPRSAGASTGCRWRSSSPRPAAGCCRRPRSRERLDAALGALGAGARDAPARQQTLRATIDWSHDLLSDDEKACFARFAVFAGGATVDAGRSRHRRRASTRSTASSPRACSCAAGRRTASTRLAMLETIRAYATERFAAAADARSRPRAPLPPFPRVGPAPWSRAGALGREPQGAPRRARRRDRQPPRRARLGGRRGRRRSRRSRCARRSAGTG